MLDLVMVVPGQDERETFSTLLSRHSALHIRPIEFEIRVHTQRDPGCFHHAGDILHTYRGLARHAIVAFDFVGSGQEILAPSEVEERCLRRLAADWQDKAAVFVITPELEAWVWSGSPHVTSALRWRGDIANLRLWLAARGLWPDGALKPPDPKAAVEAVLREVRQPRSSTIYARIAEHTSLQGCQDACFQQFRRTLSRWFAR